MLSNIKLVFLILIIGVLLFFTNIPFVNAATLQIKWLWDAVSFIYVFLTAALLLFIAVNNISYDSKEYLNIRVQYLIDTFIILSLIVILLNITMISFSSSLVNEDFNAKQWADIGLSFGVGMVTVIYGFLLSISAFLSSVFINKRHEFNSKVINVQKPKWWISIICIALILLLFGFIIIITKRGIDISNDMVITKNHYIVLSTYLFLFLAIMQKNISTIFKIFLNKQLTIDRIKIALQSLRHYMQFISSMNIIYIITTIVLMAWNFVEVISNPWKIISFLSFCLVINLAIVLFMKMFELRLNTELIGQNQSNVQSDKYFLFKYILPVFLVYMIVLVVHFIISFFK